MDSAIVCADIGTSSLKTALVSETGAVISYKRKQISNNKNSWLDAFKDSVKEILSDFTGNICAICISGNGPTLVSETGKILLWNIPGNIPAINQIQQNKSLFIPRLQLFKQIYPSDWNESKIIFSGPEYLIWQLTGNALTILPEKRYIDAYWTEETLSEYDIPSEKLPPFVLPGEEAGILCNKIACECGIEYEIPVFCGAPDFIVALIGTNTLVSGSICDRAGSSEGINLCLNIDPRTICTKDELEGIRILPSVIPNYFNASILIPDSGSSFYKIKEKCAPDMSYEDFVSEILENDDFCKDGYELMIHTANLVSNAYNRLAQISQKCGCGIPNKIRSTGGQAKNKGWLQFKANTTKVPFQVTASADAELTGDAILALYGMKKYDSIQQAAEKIVKVQREFFPKESFSE